jgi:hypothetical protein
MILMQLESQLCYLLLALLGAPLLLLLQLLLLLLDVLPWGCHHSSGGELLHYHSCHCCWTAPASLCQLLLLLAHSAPADCVHPVR